METTASSLIEKLASYVSAGRLTPEQAWSEATARILHKETRFEAHQQASHLIFSSWDVNSRGPPPLWIPSHDDIQETNLYKFIKLLQARGALPSCYSSDITAQYSQLYGLSITNPELFWTEVIQQLGISFAAPPSRILEPHIHPDRCCWLPGAKFNIAASALASPRAPSASYPAIIWAAEGAPTTLHHVSIGSLTAQAYHVAACLRRLCHPGDAVALVLPMTADAVAAYLGVVLAGCAVVSIADSFSPQEIRVRLRIAKARLVITQDVVRRGGKAHPLFQRVLQAGPPPCVVMAATPGEELQAAPLRVSDISWATFLDQASTGNTFLPHNAPADHVTNILFSSGTTGEPKAITWTQVTPIKCAADAWAHQDLGPGRVAAWPTSLGWMMGPWLLYACLLNGASIALYQGAPLGRDFGQFVEAAGVEMLGVVPSIVRAWRHSGCMQGLHWDRLRCFSSTGEASAPEDYHWLMALGGYRPVIEYCGGTELGGAYATGTLLHPAAPSTFCTPTLGTPVYLLCPDGTISSHSSGSPCTGEIALGGVLLGASQVLLNKDHAAVYYEGMPQDPGGPPGRPLRRHGDELQRWAGGRYTALGRCDDTMNLGGIKVGSVEIERAVVENVQGVVEAAAVGVPAPGGGPEQLHLFLVLSPERQGLSGGGGKELLQACRQQVQVKLNPLFKVESVRAVEALPRNASNKVMRRLLRDQVLSSRQPPRSKL